MNSYKDIGKTMGTNLSNGLLTSRTLVDNSTNKVITDNKNLFNDYSKSHITYGQSSMQNLGNAITQKSPLVATATTKVSTDNKNIMNNLSKSGLTYGTDMVNQLASGVNASSNNLTTTVKTLTDKVINQFKTGFGIHSPSVVMYKMGNYLMQGLVNGMSAKDVESFIQHWIGDITSSAGGAMSGNVTGWLSAALSVTGTPMDWMSGLLRLVQAESGGNPLSVNPQGVGNEHATGLLQTLPSTFASYAVKGLNNILNPVANAAAAINYIKSQYGSVYNTPLFKGGTYVGYAQGTNNATPGLHWVGEKGPELLNFKGGESVTPNNKISSRAQKVYSGNRNSRIVFSPTVQVTIQGAGKYSGNIADEVVKKTKQIFDTQFEKKFGTLAIQLGLDEV
jgi:SLT domain-containing protein